MDKVIFYYKPTFPQDNLGDLVINRSLVYLLSSKGIVNVEDKLLPESFRILLVEGMPNVKLLSKGTSGYKWHLLKNLATRLINRKLKVFLVEPPGHTFNLSPEVSPAHRRKLVALNFYTTLGAKMIRLGVSVGPFSPAYLKYFSRYYRKAKWLGARDTYSLHLAQEVKISSVTPFPDLAWIYPDTIQTSSIEIPRHTEKRIVLSFREVIAGGKSDQAEATFPLPSLLQLVEMAENYEVIFCHQVEQDKDYVERLYRNLDTTHPKTLLSHRLQIQVALSLYGRGAVVVSNRLHVLLLTILAGGIPLALTDTVRHHKILSMFHDLGIGDLVIDQHQPKGLDKLWMDLSSDVGAEKIRERLRQAATRSREEIFRRWNTWQP